MTRQEKLMRASAKNPALPFEPIRAQARLIYNLLNKNYDLTDISEEDYSKLALGPLTDLLANDVLSIRRI